MKKVISHHLAVHNNLKTSDCQDIAQAINPLVADAFALYIKAKNFHWHTSGAHFRDYHRLFDEQAGQILEMIDVLAERVRKLGQTTIHSVGHIKQLQSIKDDNDVLEPKKMISTLMKDNNDFVSRMRAAHQICSEKKDVATTSILEQFIDTTEERIWYLTEILKE
ncbi:DNA-binding protein [Legionella norrlandica]|uniref:DNA-binding protein n=1 Tax=Legionella norrlandica TaxID=1498499 RepID=A0A0A2SPY7_9GAMM|nr:DNA starvation/stationary phase protection protein [Legionella norrlandica]KGP63210.1 DNA-binding protein [Legionella norrlandica]